MSAIIDHAHNQFQLIIRLQSFRTQISDLILRKWPLDASAFDELRQSFGSVTFAAHVAGFGAFTGLCEQVCLRLDDMIASKAITVMSLAQLNEWAASAELYIRRPRFRHFARTLVLQLYQPTWSIVLDSESEAQLIDRLTTHSF